MHFYFCDVSLFTLQAHQQRILRDIAARAVGGEQAGQRIVVDRLVHRLERDLFSRLKLNLSPNDRLERVLCRSFSSLNIARVRALKHEVLVRHVHYGRRRR